MEGNGLQQWSGTRRLPLQRCKAPCKIWKRLSKEERTWISHNFATFQIEWGQKQSDFSNIVYLQFFFQFLLACTGRSLFGSSCVASATWSSSESGGFYDGFMWLAPQELWLGDPSKDHFPLTWQWKSLSCIGGVFLLTENGAVKTWSSESSGQNPIMPL